jgi:hypothetical protein
MPLQMRSEARHASHKAVCCRLAQLLLPVAAAVVCLLLLPVAAAVVCLLLLLLLLACCQTYLRGCAARLLTLTNTPMLI